MNLTWIFLNRTMCRISNFQWIVIAWASNLMEIYSQHHSYFIETKPSCLLARLLSSSKKMSFWLCSCQLNACNWIIWKWTTSLWDKMWVTIWFFFFAVPFYERDDVRFNEHQRTNKIQIMNGNHNTRWTHTHTHKKMERFNALSSEYTFDFMTLNLDGVHREKVNSTFKLSTRRYAYCRCCRWSFNCWLWKQKLFSSHNWRKPSTLEHFRATNILRVRRIQKRNMFFLVHFKSNFCSGFFFFCVWNVCKPKVKMHW